MADSPSLNSSGVVRVVVSSDGQQIDDTIQLISISIIQAANKIPTAKIVVADGDMPNKDFPISNQDVFKPGAKIKINAGYGQEDETIYEGVVIKHGIEISGNNSGRLIIECKDAAVAMTVARKNQNYIDSKDSDIISSIISNYADLSAKVDATTTEYKELVQYFCTDWDFMLSRAEANGMLTYVESGTVAVAPPDFSSTADLVVTYGDDLMEFQADLDARHQLNEVSSVAWDIKSQATVEEKVTAQEQNKQGDLNTQTLSEVLNVTDYRLQSSTPLMSTSLKSWAEGQHLRSGLSRIRGHMKFQGSAKAKAGALITVEGVGNRFNGDVYVTEVYHHISNGNWVTVANFGLSAQWFAEQRDLTALPASGLTPGVEGLQIAVVKKLDEDPDGQFRIQVTVPVMQAETEGVWARLLSYYATEKAGNFFLPEIGDEVVLGYLNNDPSHPVILGALYSTSHNPPYDFTAENYIKAIVTKANLKIEFDDEKKVITVITPGENKIVISDEDKSILLQDQNSNQVELSPDGIKLDSPKDIQINAQGKIDITSIGAMSLSSKADVSVEGLNINNNANVGFVAKGSATAELSASGQTTVKGAMVMIN